MDILHPVDFTTALIELQALIGEQVKVIVNHHGFFFGGGMRGRLECVQTLPPDNTAVNLVLGEGQGLFLDPAFVKAFIGGGAPDSPRWLELHFPFGLVVQVEADGRLPTA